MHADKGAANFTRQDRDKSRMLIYDRRKIMLGRRRKRGARGVGWLVLESHRDSENQMEGSSMR